MRNPREEFEKWWHEPEGYGLRCERAGSIDEAAWMAWQAAKENKTLEKSLIYAAITYGAFIGVMGSAMFWIILQ